MKSFLKSIGTAVPSYKNEQQKIAQFMAEAVGMNEEDEHKLTTLYRASGIGYRHSVIPDFGLAKGSYTFFPNTKDLEPFPTVGKRMDLYKQEAFPLVLKAVEACFDGAKEILPSTITHVITISCTGMYAPGIDIELVEALGLRKSVQRTNINFMGCYAAFNGLKVADAICKADSKATVLLVCVELCTIHYQKSNHPDQLLSNALFSDGAAAVLINSTPPKEGNALSLENFHCDLASEGKQEMAWRVSDFGFEMILSSYVPDLIRAGIKKLTDQLLASFSKEANEIDYYAIHPGGKKILEVIEDILHLDKQKNKYAHTILREYGNMSSATVLFVLKEIMSSLSTEDTHKSILSVAFGPGLTLESMLLKTHCIAQNKIFNETKELNTVSIV
jgi:alpha-pyrone synthase